MKERGSHTSSGNQNIGVVTPVISSGDMKMMRVPEYMNEKGIIPHCDIGMVRLSYLTM